MAKKKKVDQLTGQQIQAYEEVLRRVKEKLLMIEFQMSGQLTEAEKSTLAGIIRETLIELAQTKLPQELRKQMSPEMARKIDDIMKIFLPDEH